LFSVTLTYYLGLFPYGHIGILHPVNAGFGSMV
jgi:hypothetical protein